MKTDSIEVCRVLQDSRRFTVPIYQRQYAWKEDRLNPFWDDLVSKAEEIQSSPPKFQHYMGALILAPGADGYSVGRLSSVQVVDGQQRLTTFQLFLAALRNVAAQRSLSSVVSALDVYIFNDQRSFPHETLPADRLKLLPTPADRSIFRDLLTEPLAEVRKRHSSFFYKNGSVVWGRAPRALNAYVFFETKIRRYIERGPEPDEGDVSVEAVPPSEGLCDARLQALADSLLLFFKLVIITLEEGDDAQVIFETLNSRGEPLLAMDLVRNNIFHRAEAHGEEAERLFETRWKPFDDVFWKQDAPRAKPKRPRIDHFLSHALTALTGEETSLRELYAEYRSFVKPKGHPRFSTVGEELDTLLAFAPSYEALERAQGDSGLARLGRKLATWEVTTAYPLIFAVSVAAIEDDQKQALYDLIYSYVVRRALCGWPTQGMNKTFARLVANFIGKGVSTKTLADTFSDIGRTARFPTDADLEEAIRTKPVYETIQRAERLVDVLWELERRTRTKFQVDEGRPGHLSIEHVLPQWWYPHWPAPDGTSMSGDQATWSDEQKAFARTRNQRLHVLGNLTLVTVPLNSSMQNQGFSDKGPRLRASLLSMNHVIGSEPSWDEASIDSRGEALAAMAVKIWPAAT